MNQGANYVDMMITKTLSWVDAIIAFINQYKDLFVIGFLAMMASKLVKVNLKLGGK